MILVVDLLFFGSVGDTPGWSVSGIFHNISLMYLGNWMNIFLLRLIVNYFDLKTYVHISLHSFTIDTSDMCIRLGNIWPSHDSSGKSGKSSKHGLLDSIFGHLGIPHELVVPCLLIGDMEHQI